VGVGQEGIGQVGPVEAPGQLADRGLASRTHLADDAGDGRADLGRRRGGCPQATGLRALGRIGEVEQADHAGPPTRSSTGRSCSSLSRYEARFTTSRALTCRISSITTRPFSFRVRPVSTRSTIASARSATAASSTDPDSGTRSTGTPRRAKVRAVSRGYLVATR